MKVFVVTNTKGTIVGTIFSAPYKDAPSPGRPSALRGQQIHEVDLPRELEGNTSVEILHRELARLIHKPRRPSAQQGKRTPSKVKRKKA